MVQFSKTIMEGVSFDRVLFEKELRKLITWFEENETQKTIFQLWCLQKFGNQYHEIITDAFKNNKEVKKKIQVHVLLDAIT